MKTEFEANKIIFVGNPNTGKTTIFNRLTGLNQSVGNYPGVTVDKKTGVLKHNNKEIEILDLPGTYSIYPHSLDERVVYDEIILNRANNLQSIYVVILDASNLERNLLIFTQLYDLNLPIVAVLNMHDIAIKKGNKIDLTTFENKFPGVTICATNGRVGFGIDKLKNILSSPIELKKHENILPNFKVSEINDINSQEKEIQQRFEKIQNILPQIVDRIKPIESKTSILDKLSIHPFFGYLIFSIILFSIFQLIFSIASLPMDLIDGAFTDIASWFEKQLPSGIFTELLTQGIIPGLGGVLVFLPQILLLFFCLGILDETGYLARAVFIMDKLMRPFGLSGRSVVPLISSAACAIPGVMATRTIPNWKERLISILVAPLMSCSARLPVFTLLIALVIPNKTFFGVINLQGLTLFMLYFLGIFSALMISIILKKILKTEEKSYLLLEIPAYKAPRWQNILMNLYEKAKIFVLEAGKVILIISILLWALARFGPGNRMETAVQKFEQKNKINETENYESKLASVKLENSYIGILGKSIEPVIKPLGFDWKIGISLLTSFAAREVFVGSMSTIYSVHQSEDNVGLLQKMRNEKYENGSSVYTLASGLSLMVFYVYAMQCMATLAIVKRETKSWKWPFIQLVYMGILAYIASLLVYQLLK
jgi:ferrous iron transport protein B